MSLLCVVFILWAPSISTIWFIFIKNLKLLKFVFLGIISSSLIKIVLDIWFHPRHCLTLYLEFVYDSLFLFYLNIHSELLILFCFVLVKRWERWWSFSFSVFYPILSTKLSFHIYACMVVLCGNLGRALWYFDWVKNERGLFWLHTIHSDILKISYTSSTFLLDLARKSSSDTRKICSTLIYFYRQHQIWRIFIVFHLRLFDHFNSLMYSRAAIIIGSSVTTYVICSWGENSSQPQLYDSRNQNWKIWIF